MTAQPQIPIQPVEKSKRQLWMAAIKPPMYSVAIIPVWVGSAIAFSETQQFDGPIFFTCLAAAILIIAWMNLTNDAFDANTGIDANKAHSVVNLTGNQPLVLGLGNLCLGLALLGLGAISWWQQDPTVLGLMLLGCLLGYSYQGPPFRLGYQGLGEIICFLCFTIGGIAIYYSQTQTQSLTNLAGTIIVAIVTSLILFCSHFHQLEDDLAASKRSPIVRLGTARAAKILPWFGGSIYALTVVCIALQLFPLWTLLVLLSLPLLIVLCRHVGTYHDQPDKVSNCKFIAVAMHFSSGVLLSVGFLLSTINS